MKALEKDRNRRYETANSLARDIERYLHDEPVQACPPSAAYKFRKFARRNKAALLTAALVFVTIVVGFAVSTVLIAQERDAAQAAAKGQAVAAQQAKDAAQQAKDQEAIAQQERDRAERHYQAARATVDRMFTRAAGELQSVPHTEKIRRALLEDALGFYQEFLKAKADDPSLRLETALAAVRVGTIRFILGQFREALPPLRLGLSLLEELAKRFPAEPRYRVEMAQAHFMLAQATHWLGEGTEEMIAHRRKRVALFDGLHHDFPATPQYLMQAASAHADFGCNLQSKGFPNESLEQFEKAAALFKKHRTDFPNEPEDPHFVGYIDHWRGAALERLGRLQDAELSYRKAHDFRKRLVAEQPRVALYVFELGHIKAYLANLLMNSGRLAEAAQLWREALLIHEKLRDDFPDSTDLGHKTGTDYDGLGTVLSAMGRTAEAETALRRSLAIRAKIAADAQANEFHSLQLAWAHYHLGVLLHSTGKSKEAADAFREAIAIVEKIVAQHPDIPQYQSQLASILATCPAVQFRDPQRAVKLAKQALQRQPQVARHWGVLGVAQYRANDPAAAIESLSKRMEMLDAVGSQWLWFVMAMAHHKLGNHPQARQWYDKAAAWMDKNQPPDEDYGRFRAEAAELLGIKEHKKKSSQSPQKKD